MLPGVQARFRSFLRKGLAIPPKPRVAHESLNEKELVAKALAERGERTKIEKMAVRTADGTRPWTDYTVTNRTSGKSYRVALRGLEPGVSYCSSLFPSYLRGDLAAVSHSTDNRHACHYYKSRSASADLGTRGRQRKQPREVSSCAETV